MKRLPYLISFISLTFPRLKDSIPQLMIFIIIKSIKQKS